MVSGNRVKACEVIHGIEDPPKLSDDTHRESLLFKASSGVCFK